MNQERAVPNNLIEEMRPLHNHICILYESELVRLVGIHDGEYDYYYRVRSIQPGGKGEYLASAVGHIVSLKHLYPEERYATMDATFALNGAGPSDNFLVTAD